VRVHNNSLELETGMGFDEYTEHIAHTGSDEAPEAYVQIKNLRETISDLEAQLTDVRAEILTNKLAE
jgi:DNA-directed RNA polymerase sigma subunit (sigma70/sigma32)